MNTAILYYILGFFTGLMIILPTMAVYKRTIAYKNKIINDLLDKINNNKNTFEWSSE
jgi:hypothetical protein